MAVFDPLDSTQITVDPELGKLPKNPLAARIAQLVAAGFTEEEAAKIAHDEMSMHGGRAVAAGVADHGNPVADAARAERVRRLRQREAGQAAFEASYLTPEAPADVSDVDAMLGRQMLPNGQYEKVGQIGHVEGAFSKDAPRRVPGPRSLAGTPVDPGKAFDTPEDEAAYDDRAPVGDGTYKPSQKDLDMLARGMVPVFNPDGSVGYTVAAPNNSMPSPRELVEQRGAPGRPGFRQDLLDAGYVARSGQAGPLGPQTTHVPVEAKQRQSDYLERRQIERQAVAAGVSPSDMAKLDVADRMATVANARVAGELDRRAQWKAQAMLAGANPRKNAVNALTMLTPEQQRRSLQYMLPGGQLTASVDAMNMQTANNLLRQYMTSGAVGNADSPAARAAADMAVAKAQEDLPPEAAADMERKKNAEGKLPATSRAGQRMLKKIDADIIGTFATDAEIETAVEEAVRSGIDEQSARDFFERRRNDVMFFGTSPGSARPAGGADSAQAPMPRSRPM